MGWVEPNTPLNLSEMILVIELQCQLLSGCFVRASFLLEWTTFLSIRRFFFGFQYPWLSYKKNPIIMRMTKTIIEFSFSLLLLLLFFHLIIVEYILAIRPTSPSNATKYTVTSQPKAVLTCDCELTVIFNSIFKCF